MIYGPKQRVETDWTSPFVPTELAPLLDRTIVAVRSTEFSLRLELDDGSSVDVVGHTYEDCSLEVEINPPEKP